MADDKKINPLLSSLEEIKSQSQEEVPSQPVRTKEEPAPTQAKPKTAGGLLDSLLSEVREEADREVQEITRSLEEKTALERKMQEDEERRKKEQYDKLIQDEARRRLNLIKKKEDEKKRKVLEVKEQEEKRQRILAEKARHQKRQKQLRVVLAGLGVALVAVLVLVFTGIIPVLPETAVTSSGIPVDELATGGGPARFPARKKVDDSAFPVIAEPTPEPDRIGVDGPASRVLDIPEKHDVQRFALQRQPVPQAAPQIEEEVLRTRLANAFARMHSSSGGSSGSSGSSDTGIKIDNSIFKD